MTVDLVDVEAFAQAEGWPVRRRDACPSSHDINDQLVSTQARRPEKRCNCKRDFLVALSVSLIRGPRRRRETFWSDARRRARNGRSSSPLRNVRTVVSDQPSSSFEQAIQARPPVSQNHRRQGEEATKGMRWRCFRCAVIATFGPWIPSGVWAKAKHRPIRHRSWSAD